MHFVSNNITTTFKLQQKIGPFVVNNETTRKIVEDLLKDLNFRQGEKLKYDPYSVILEKRKQNKLSSYEDQANSDR
jgi:hypothetical protein